MNTRPDHVHFLTQCMLLGAHVSGRCRPQKGHIRIANLARCIAVGLAALASAGWGSTPSPIGPEVNEFAVHPAAPNAVLAATRFGVFRSKDGGNSWYAATAPGHPLHATLVWSVLFPGSNPQEVVAVTQHDGIYHSEDGGAAWRRLAPPVHAATENGSFEKSIYALAGHPTNPAIMLLGTGNGIFYSANTGASWKHVHTRERIHVGGIAFDPVDPSRVYAGSSRLLKSSDGGLTWTGASPQSLTTLQRPWLGRFLTRRDPTPTIFMDAAGITAASKDQGETWQHVQQACGTLAVSQSGGGTLLTSCGYPYLGVSPPGSPVAGVSKSLDDGLNWTSVNQGLPRSWSASVVAINPSRPDTYLAGWANGGVYRTIDGGASWTNASTGLTWCDLDQASPMVQQMRILAMCPDGRSSTGNRGEASTDDSR